MKLKIEVFLVSSQLYIPQIKAFGYKSNTRQNCYKAHTGIVDNLMEVFTLEKRCRLWIQGRKLQNLLHKTKATPVLNSLQLNKVLKVPLVRLGFKDPEIPWREPTASVTKLFNFGSLSSAWGSKIKIIKGQLISDVFLIF